LVCLSIPNLFLIEDALKFVGIVGWLAYFARTALQAFSLDSLTN